MNRDKISVPMLIITVPCKSCVVSYKHFALAELFDVSEFGYLMEDLDLRVLAYYHL